MKLNSRAGMRALGILPASALLLAPWYALADQAPAATPSASAPAAQAKPDSLDISGMPKDWIRGTPVTEWKKDEVYILEFWATWCGPCIAAMPHVEELYKEFSGKGVSVIGINVWDKKTPEDIRNFLAKRPNITYPMALDGETGPAQKLWLKPLQIKGIPAAVIVRNGKIMWQGNPRQITSEMISAILANKPLPQKISREEKNQAFKQKIAEVDTACKAKDYSSAIKALDSWIGKQEVSPNEAQFFRSRIANAMISGGDSAKAGEFWISVLKTPQPDATSIIAPATALIFNNKISPEQKQLPELVRILEAQIASAKENVVKSRLYALISECKALSPETKADAIPAQLQAIAFSKTSSAFNSLKKSMGESAEAKDFIAREILPRVDAIAALPAVPKEWANWDNQKPDSYFSPFLEKVDWLGSGNITGLPAGKFAILNFWVQPDSPEVNDFQKFRGPATLLCKVLAKHNLSGKDNLSICTIVPNAGTDPKALKETLGWKFMSSDFPLGLAKDGSIWSDLMQKNDLKEVPTCMVARDNMIIWAGETSRIPTWVFETIKANPSSEQLAALVAKRKEATAAERELLKPYFQLLKDSKYDEALALVKQHEDKYFPSIPMVSFVCDVKTYCMKESGDSDGIFKELEATLDKYPMEFNVTSSLHKSISSYTGNEQQRALALEIKAVEQLAKSEVSSRTDYASGCYEYAAELSAKANNPDKIRENIIKAYMASPEVAALIALKRGH